MLISLGVRFAGQAPTLGSALTVSAFNLGTAVGSWIAGRALDSSLGATGPAAVGAAIVALTQIPTIAIAVVQRRPSHRTIPAASNGRPETAGVIPMRAAVLAESGKTVAVVGWSSAPPTSSPNTATPGRRRSRS